MPYIDEKRKYELDEGSAPVKAGELNYLLTQQAIDYLRANTDNYETRNAIMGAFASAAAEFYRRVVVPYEEKKILENGDVYK